MSEFNQYDEALTTDAEPAPTRQHRSTRKPPLTPEQRLAKAIADVETLQVKVIARRDEQRHELIEDLYQRFEIDEFESDLSETKRLAALSAKLVP